MKLRIFNQTLMRLQMACHKFKINLKKESTLTCQKEIHYSLNSTIVRKFWSQYYK